MTRLEASESDIRDLTGLEFATGLTSLILYDNVISDLTPLSGLTNLANLSLSHNSISDLSPLSDLTNLARLWLYNNGISDISALVANTGLGTGDLVDVRNNPLSTISQGTHIPALQDREVDVRFGALKPAVEKKIR